MNRKIRKQIDKLEKIQSNKKYCSYVPEKSAIYVTSRSLSTVSVLARDLQKLCKKEKINELVIMKKNNDEFINAFLREMKQLSDIPELLVIHDVTRITDRDTKIVILNDFHLLPTSGHAGVNRMLNNIKNITTGQE